jgi:[citrate (pro-3S)-lyase] ligase
LDFFPLVEKTILRSYPNDIKAVSRFLNHHGLRLDEDVEYTMAIYDHDSIIATGSFSGRILKCIAVDEAYQGMGAAARVLSHLINEAYQRGNTHLFIYTKPESGTLFKNLGFYEIARVSDHVMLLENRHDGIQSYIEELKRNQKAGSSIASIVMNCNPFTLGHQYVIEKAAAENDVLHIFVLWEDKSSFPTEVRYHLIKEGTKHLSNVVVHKAKDYIVSTATFPSYFLKENQDAVKTQVMLDLKIFGMYIVPSLGINRRYVGEEPYCPVTAAYNAFMQSMLPDYGIEVIVVPRLTDSHEAISASRVRKHIQDGEMEKVKELVPKSTYDFLTAPENHVLIERIKNRLGRH